MDVADSKKRVGEARWPGNPWPPSDRYPHCYPGSKIRNTLTKPKIN
jgi:hypothetical protein